MVPDTGGIDVKFRWICAERKIFVKIIQPVFKHPLMRQSVFVHRKKKDTDVKEQEIHAVPKTILVDLPHNANPIPKEPLRLSVTALQSTMERIAPLLPLAVQTLLVLMEELVVSIPWNSVLKGSVSVPLVFMEAFVSMKSMSVHQILVSMEEYASIHHMVMNVAAKVIYWVKIVKLSPKIVLCPSLTVPCIVFVLIG